MHSVFRFRSSLRLLNGEFSELERQIFYFASPNELNDPMEGFKDLVWDGDRVVWVNFLRHFLLILENVCSQASLADKNSILVAIFKSRTQFPTQLYRDLMAEIETEFFANSTVNDFIADVSTRTEPLGKDEVHFLLKILHPFALKSIFSTYEKHGLNSLRADALQKLIGHSLQYHPVFKTKLSKYDVIAWLALEASASIQRLALYREKKVNSNFNVDPNAALVFLDFPKIFLTECEKLVFPDWYALTFTDSISSAAMWGYYGDEHKGICLEFSGIGSKGNLTLPVKGINTYDEAGFSRPKRFGEMLIPVNNVNYVVEREPHNFFDLLLQLPLPELVDSWYTGPNGEKSRCGAGFFGDPIEFRKSYWAKFQNMSNAKLGSWQHETELRAVLPGDGTHAMSKSDRTLEYDFSCLTSITFGIRTPDDEKLNIIEIIHQKCLKLGRRDFHFHQAYFDPEAREIRRFPIASPFKFIAEGM